MSKIFSAYYDKKYFNNSYRSARKILVNTYPRDRFEAAVFWGGRGESLLEIGAGDGSVLLTLSERYQHCVGTELSTRRGEELRKLFQRHKNVEIVIGDFEDETFNFSEESFDTVLLNAVLEHLIDPFSVVSKIYKILKKRGRLIIVTPNVAKWTRRIKLLFGYFPSTSSLEEGFLEYDKMNPSQMYDGGHLHYFTYRSLKKMLKKFYFSDVKSFGYGKTFLSRIYPRLFSECFVIGIK